MPRAVVTVLLRPPYHGDKMMEALRGLGYKTTTQPLGNPKPGDVFVTWNRHESRDEAAKAHEKAGGTVLVVENGYFGRNFRGSEWYALAKGHHNGAGEWPKGDKARWAGLGVDVRPWKKDGSEIVVLATRNMGHADCREPRGWSEYIAGVIEGRTGRRVRVRKHPGPQWATPDVSLQEDLGDAWAAVTWGSTAGLKALAMGIPVFYGFKKWIGAPAGEWVKSERLERNFCNRTPMFSRVATAMWSLDEIASGRAFECLLLK